MPSVYPIDLTASLSLTPPAVGLVAIYALVSPDDDAIHYIGKTSNPIIRLRGHLKPSDAKKCRHKASWLKSLRARGLKPHMRVLAWIPEIDWPETERAFIAAALAAGCHLTNGADGGKGGSRKGRTKAPEERARLSAARRGKPVDEKTAERLRMYNRNRIFTPEYRAKLTAGQMGRIVSEETKAKISAANKARHKERKERGYKRSAESCAKTSASLRATWARRKAERARNG